MALLDLVQKKQMLRPRRDQRATFGAENQCPTIGARGLHVIFTSGMYENVRRDSN